MTSVVIASRRPAAVAFPALLALLASAFIVACSGESSTATVGPTPTARVVEVAVSPGELILYVGRGESLVGPIIEEFADLTGIDVEVKYGGTAELASTLLRGGRQEPGRRVLRSGPRRFGRRGGHVRSAAGFSSWTGSRSGRAHPTAGGWAFPAAPGRWCITPALSPRTTSRTTYGA